MYHVSILTIGKCKERWLQEALALYEERLKPYLKLEMVLLRDLSALENQLQRLSSVIALDPEGKSVTSTAFANLLEKRFEEHGPKVAFLIGPAEGLPEAMRRRYPLISLSQMTFTHQMARLILVEQLYRACQIMKGTPYHK